MQYETAWDVIYNFNEIDIVIRLVNITKLVTRVDMVS